MNVYLVRAASNGEVVGVFAATSLARLALVVDECCDPGVTEYLEVGEGGYYVPHATSAVWPPRFDKGADMPDERDVHPLDRGGLSGEWFQALSGDWRPLKG